MEQGARSREQWGERVIFMQLIKSIMSFSLNGYLYQVAADPLISRLHTSVLPLIEPSHRVLDVACGTGCLSLSIAKRAMHVTGIDLSEDMIITARRAARKHGVKNTLFELRDASDLSCYRDKEFDISVTSMAVHQFKADLAVRILKEMKRISETVVVVDYNSFMPKGPSGSAALGIEWLAGGEHARNFRIFMERGGIRYFTAEAGLTIKSETLRGNGVFSVAVCG
jgi:ubiquinone/menaquinone biosynthesis C-methylase UbiE